MTSPQILRKGIFSRLRTTNTARPASPAPSTSSIPSPPMSSVGSTLSVLGHENGSLRNRCEELTQQSQLNQELFQQCSQKLLAKEGEVKDLKDQLAKYEELTAGLKKHIQVADRKDDHIELLESRTRTLEQSNTEKDALIHKHDVQISNLQEQLQRAHVDSVYYANQFTKQCASVNALHLRRDCMQAELGSKQALNTDLEHQVDFLAMHVARATEAVHKRDKLVSKLRTQLQQLVECHTKEAEEHAQQKRALDCLYEMNIADQERFNAQSKAQNAEILSLKDMLTKAQKEVDKVTANYHKEVADLKDTLRRTALDLQTEVAKNIAWL